ncbi:hypothetical protein AVEN_34571-1 [Araneus ventricosus]|uniref:Uncharacterized protein n=1 Tax=Araneus ventricosus TaxID=182803 RepID=A0A4Y2AZ48_ARAVE|nr:hypothetical protein AVEN_34571-1 [Araneus ventricosus]
MNEQSRLEMMIPILLLHQYRKPAEPGSSVLSTGSTENGSPVYDISPSPSVSWRRLWGQVIGRPGIRLRRSPIGIRHLKILLYGGSRKPGDPLQRITYFSFEIESLAYGLSFRSTLAVVLKIDTAESKVSCLLKSISVELWIIVVGLF